MNIDNNEITRTIAQDKEKGFRLLMAKFSEPLYWHIRRLVVSHDDAQDVEQETFIKAYRSIDRLDNKDALTAWIYRIATRQALTLLERNKKTTLMSEALGEQDAMADMTADSYVDFSDLEAVRLQKAILSLPRKQQLAFNLRYYDEMDYDQIAQVAETTATTARVNYHLAKEKIIRYMQQELEKEFEIWKRTLISRP